MRSSTFIPSCSSLRQGFKLVKGLEWLLSVMLGLKCFLRISWMRSGLAILAEVLELRALRLIRVTVHLALLGHLPRSAAGSDRPGLHD